MGNPCL